MNDIVSNVGIVRSLCLDHKIYLRTIRRLHKLMEKMGLIEKDGQRWKRTSEGERFASGNRADRGDLWKEEVIEYIAERYREGESQGV